ncbi:MAG: hypothetical protein GY835_15730 [bacterium]|nr:hypothetical protein [bacterium]
MPDPTFSDPCFGINIYLHMAALASLDGRFLSTRMDLLAYVLEREYAYLDRLLAKEVSLRGQVDGKALAETLTLATLVMAARPQAASDDLPDISAIMVGSGGEELAATALGRRRLTELLAKTYTLPEAPKTTSHMDALRPDPLGEGLVFSTLETDPTLLAVFAADGWRAPDLDSACTVLKRSALALSDKPSAWLFNRIGQSGIDQDERFLGRLNESIIQPQLFDLSKDLAGVLVAIARAAYDGDASDDSTDTGNRLAGRLNNFGINLSRAGYREEALEATSEAVEIKRELAARNPKAFNPDLAMSCGAMGASLSAGADPDTALLEPLLPYFEESADA